MRFLVVVVLVVMLLAGTVAGCRRPCESELNCKRTCDCLNRATNSRDECTIAFRCDGAEQVCETQYNAMSCDELCSLYAARALCGTERCASDADCVKNLTCDCRDANGNPTGRQYQCVDGNHLCDLTVEACEASSTLPDAEHCIAECPQPATCL